MIKSMLVVEMKDCIIDLRGKALVGNVQIGKIHNGFFVHAPVLTPLRPGQMPSMPGMEGTVQMMTVFCHTVRDVHRLMAGLMQCPTYPVEVSNQEG